MSILNSIMPRGTPLRRALTLRHFHPTIEFAGCLLVLALAGLTAVVSQANQGTFDEQPDQARPKSKGASQ